MNKYLSYVETYEQKGNRFYLIPKQIKELEEKIPLESEHSGIFLGENKGGKFHPSIALLEMVQTEDKITLDSKGEWLFICGRDISSSHIIGEIKVNSDFIVLNNKGEVLGLGKLEGENVHNIFDRGDFLRRESNQK